MESWVTATLGPTLARAAHRAAVAKTERTALESVRVRLRVG